MPDDAKKPEDQTQNAPSPPAAKESSAKPDDAKKPEASTGKGDKKISVTETELEELRAKAAQFDAAQQGGRSVTGGSHDSVRTDVARGVVPAWDFDVEVTRGPDTGKSGRYTAIDESDAKKQFVREFTKVLNGNNTIVVTCCDEQRTQRLADYQRSLHESRRERPFNPNEPVDEKKNPVTI